MRYINKRTTPPGVVARAPPRVSGNNLFAAMSVNYWNDPDVKATAEFIKNMKPSSLKRRRKLPFGPEVIVYGIVIFIMLNILFLNFNTKPKVEVKRTITETPLIRSDVEITTGIGERADSVSPTEWFDMSLATPCDGIERFYTNSTFMADWTNMLEEYEGIYSSIENEQIVIKTPSEMSANTTSYDCEDIAHATRCLAMLYGIECSFWESDNIGEVVPRTGGHVGVCCNADGWKCI